ncbi:MAG: hypothetical protein WDN75_04665 [Bacteroidota bacterium]
MEADAKQILDKEKFCTDESYALIRNHSTTRLRPTGSTGIFDYLNSNEDGSLSIGCYLSYDTYTDLIPLEHTVLPLTKDDNHLILIDNDYISAENSLSEEATAKIWIKIYEDVEGRNDINLEAAKLLLERIRDRSIHRTIELLASIKYKSLKVAITSEPSLFFTIQLDSQKTLFFENFLDEKSGEPQIVYLLYFNDDCISNGMGDIESITNKLSASI